MQIPSFTRWLWPLLLSFLLAWPAWSIEPALGIGEVREITTRESMSQANALYQSQAAGMPANRGVAVGVDRSVSRTGYVKFDGINRATNTLYDAKGFGYRIDKSGNWTQSTVSRKMQIKLQAQLNRQLAAARGAGMQVEWRVPSAHIKEGMNAIAKGKIAISVVEPSQQVLDTLKGHQTGGSL